MISDLLPPTVRRYSLSDICAILKKAESMGFPLERGSWVEQLTIDQLELLMRGAYDA